MTIELNHTIVPCRDPQASATFLAEILGLPAPHASGPFLAVELDNGVTLDFGADAAAAGGHYAFLVDDDAFDAGFGRIVERRLTYWADPLHRRPMTVNEHHGGRGVYFTDPSGHNMEILTRA
ncbi:MAG: Glyoxalase/bleomycin resistance protein/dioxygenase [Actinomycetia bacterium]|nr:Glyoxalase/bleomycin resistance protein/dioxygenase [Actinomycetes bacterium]